MTGIPSHSSLGLLCVDESNNFLRPDLRPLTRLGPVLKGSPMLSYVGSFSDSEAF